MCYTAAYFRTEEQILAATAEARAAGYTIDDVYTPYPVHGMDDAMGLRRSRLTWVAALAGFVGVSGGIALQVWVSASDWPLNIGGKPFIVPPLLVPVAFELTVLLAGLTTLFAFFYRSRLHPLSRNGSFHRATDDLFVLVLRQSDGSMNIKGARGIFKRHHALSIQEGVQPA
jgi:hypothetical protein